MEPVIISIIGGSGLAPDADVVEFITSGTLEAGGDKTVLSYAETELSGVEGTTTRIILEEDAVSLHRSGTSETFMHFARGKQSTAQVNTPYGDTMNVYTHSLVFKSAEEGGRLDLRYTIELGGQSSENAIWVQYKSPRC